MGKKKNRYRFSREQLKFVEDKLTAKGRIWVIAKYLLASILLTILYYFVFSQFVYLGNDRRTLRQNRAMQQEYKQLQKEIKVLNGTVASLQEKDREIYRTIFNANPPEYPDQLSKSSTYVLDLDTVKDDKIIELISRRLVGIRGNVLAVRGEIDTINHSLAVIGPSAKNIPSIVPIENFNPQAVGASIGKKINPFFKSVLMHNGLDIPAAEGTAVLAPADGTVERTGSGDRSGGNSFVINHLNGYKTRFSHLGAVYVRSGQKITQGMTIARVGTSGMSFAPHLHYEVIFNGKYLDPVNYFFASLDARQTMVVLRISQNTGQSLD